MRRIFTALVMIALGLSLAVTTAQAEDHPDELPEHAHALVLGLELEFPDGPEGEPVPVAYRKCVDVAANRAITLRAHHSSIHVGTAGWGNVAVGLQRGGHGVVPLYPLTPFENCDQLVAAFFPAG